jgi:hypothetical protein
LYNTAALPCDSVSKIIGFNGQGFLDWREILW